MKQATIQRTRGFRFSVVDAVALAAFGGFAILMFKAGSTLWWLLLIAAGHFFLFCNVFRVVRRLELIWAGLFVLNVAIWAWLERAYWLLILLCQMPATLAVIIATLKSARYHGILAKRLNPGLHDYLEGRLQ